MTRRLLRAAITFGGWALAALLWFRDAHKAEDAYEAGFADGESQVGG